MKFSNYIRLIISKIKFVKSIYIKFKTKPKIHRTVVFKGNRKLVKLDIGCELKDYVIIQTYNSPIVVGKHSQINPFTVIYCDTGVFIGDNVMIAPHCMIASGNHNYKQTNMPMRYADTLSKGPIHIEDNVWIGANCTITDGIRIGHDAVIAANSVVTKDVEPFSIVGGVPARFISNRLSNDLQ